MGDHIQVAVRLRPLNRRELSLNSSVVVEIDKATQQTRVRNPQDGKVIVEFIRDERERESNCRALGLRMRLNSV
jgi:hypothetical protein